MLDKTAFKQCLTTKAIGMLKILKQFLQGTMKHLQNKHITDGTRNDIISSIAKAMYQPTPYSTSEEYTSVLVEKYTFLKDSSGNDYVTIPRKKHVC